MTDAPARPARTDFPERPLSRIARRQVDPKLATPQKITEVLGRESALNRVYQEVQQRTAGAPGPGRRDVAGVSGPLRVCTAVVEPGRIEASIGAIVLDELDLFASDPSVCGAPPAEGASAAR